MALQKKSEKIQLALTLRLKLRLKIYVTPIKINKMLSILKKKWKEYTIELFLVMIGIIIPFLIYKCNDNLQTHKKAKVYQTMLHSDLNDDLKVLQINCDNIISDCINPN